jgi:hypothetical protein
MDSQKHASCTGRKGYPSKHFIKALFVILYSTCSWFQICCWKLKINLYTHDHTRHLAGINLSAMSLWNRLPFISVSGMAQDWIRSYCGHERPKPDVMWMNMAHWWNDTGRKPLNTLRKPCTIKHTWTALRKNSNLRINNSETNFSAVCSFSFRNNAAWSFVVNVKIFVTSV